MDQTPYEIERKYLIRYPDLAWLEARAEPSRITQTYLLNGEGCTERVRSRETDGRTVYTHTTKKRRGKKARKVLRFYQLSLCTIHPAALYKRIQRSRQIRSIVDR